MYVLTSMSPLTVLTHRHPTPGIVVVGAGVHRWWLVGGCLSNDSMSRVVSDDHIMAVMWCEIGGWHWQRRVRGEAGPVMVIACRGPGVEEGGWMGRRVAGE